MLRWKVETERRSIGFEVLKMNETKTPRPSAPPLLSMETFPPAIDGTFFAALPLYLYGPRTFTPSQPEPPAAIFRDPAAYDIHQTFFPKLQHHLRRKTKSAAASILPESINQSTVSAHRCRTMASTSESASSAAKADQPVAIVCVGMAGKFSRFELRQLLSGSLI